MTNASESRRNRFLKTACAVFIVFLASHTLIQLASFPSYYQRISTATVPTVTVGSEVTMSNQLIAGRAADRGLSLAGYAVYSIVLNLITLLAFGSVAALILWKARQEWFHWFTAFVLLFYPSGGLWEITQVTQIAYRYVAFAGVFWPSFLLFLYLFPNGQAVPRWTRWIVGPAVVAHLGLQMAGVAGELGWAQDRPLHEFITTFFVVVPVAFAVIALSQIYRYWRHSTPVERVQIRWFVAGLAAWLVISSFTEPDSSSALRSNGLLGDVGEMAALIIPISIGIAILRYRLYDIDLILRRTLIYGVLTGALALTYLGSVVLLQRVVGGQAGQTAPWVIVVSTLVIAALFRPLHRRIQTLIDRRFFRRRYNAQETLTAFSEKLRAPDQATLDRLTGELVEVIQETMQPAHVSLWLRKIPGRGGANQADQYPPMVR